MLPWCPPLILCRHDKRFDRGLLCRSTRAREPRAEGPECETRVLFVRGERLRSFEETALVRVTADELVRADVLCAQGIDTGGAIAFCKARALRVAHERHVPVARRREAQCAQEHDLPRRGVEQ